MLVVRAATCVALALTLLAACTGGSGSAQRRPTAAPHRTPSANPSPSATPTGTATPTLGPPQPLSLSVTQLTSGLAVPWEVVPLPDGRLLISERGGDIRLFQNGSLVRSPVLQLDVKSSPGVESGVLGMALDPHYPTQPYLYVYYTTPGNVNRLSRFTVGQGGAAGITLTAEQALLDNIPGGDCCHFGGRIKFGPDGDLYVGVGDGEVPTRAEDVSSPNGKILRITTPQGGVPADNPFPGSAVWAYGLRNPQGFGWDAQGRMYASDNGPTGDLGLYHLDEIDLIQKGGFYGWPLYAANTRTSEPAPANSPTPIAPILDSGSSFSWAPSGVAFFAAHANEQPSLFVAELNGEALMRVTLSATDPSQVTGSQNVVSGHGRLRDVVPYQGCLLLLTSNDDGRGSGATDQLLRACAS